MIVLVDNDADVVLPLNESDALVGLIGATAVAVLDKGGQMGDPHARFVGQQPPPRLAAQLWYPAVQ